MMRHLLLPLTLLASWWSIEAMAQCQITTSANDTEITCGTCVTLSAFGNGTGNVAFAEDFNSGAPVGWQFTQSATFSNPCSPAGVDGTPHLWMGDASPNPRTLTTLPLDLSLGGYICFDLLFAEQDEATPCEGPDEPQEGVYLQYSIDNGATWVDITYFDPNGGNDPQLTNWNNWCFALPLAAATGNTIIRWQQEDVTSAEYDHWGIDNVEITLNDPNFEVIWQHDGYGYGLGAPGGENPTPVCPEVTTSYTAIVTDGTTTCESTITITVNEPVIILDAGPDVNVCPGECVELQAEAYHLVSPASTPTYSNNEVSIIAVGGASVNINVQDLNTTALVDGSVTQVCINGFFVAGGASPCLNFGGCPCNGGTIGFGEICDINSGSFTVTLTAPGGCEITLVPAGTSTDAYQNTCFVPVGGAPFGPGFPNGGAWNPEEPFSGLNGCDANGVWTLSFEAPGAISLGIGALNGWSITFDDPEIIEPVDFVWSPTTDMTNENTLSPTVCHPGAGTYTLTATDLAGCLTVSDEVEVTTDGCCLLEVVDIFVIPVSCFGDPGAVEILELANAVGDVTYSLDGGPTQAEPFFEGLDPGTYIITVNDDNNCEVNVTVDIVQDNGPVIQDVTVEPSSCVAEDGSITLSATGLEVNYSFDGGTSFTEVPEATGLASGTYAVVLADAFGCVFDTLITVPALDGPQIISVDTTDPLCSGSDGTITIVASPNAVTFSIDGGITTQTDGEFVDLVPGIYNVSVADAAGCAAVVDVVLEDIPGPVVVDVIGTDPSCGDENGAIEIIANGTGLVYSIDGGLTEQASPLFTGLAQGTYQVEITDAVGCVANEVILLQTLNGPVIDAVLVEDTGCGLSEGSVTINATGNGLTFSIDGGLTYGPDNAWTDLPAGTYDLAVQDGTGCVLTTEATVAEGEGPELIGVVVTEATCGLNDGSAIVTATGPGVAYSIDGGVTTQPTGDLTDLAPGLYTVQVTVAGCSEQQDFTVPEAPGPTIQDVVVTQPNCAGDNDGSLEIEATGAGTLSYALDGAAPQASAVFQGLAAGTYSVAVIAEPGGCQATQDVTIAAPAVLVLGLSATDPACTGDCSGSISAAIGGGTLPYTLVWSGAVAPGTAELATDLCSGSYGLTVTDANGCAADSSVVLLDPAPFVVENVLVTPETCPDNCDGTVTILATGATLYGLNGVAPQPSPVFSGLCPGAYDITVANANGCQAEGSALVGAGEPVDASFVVSPARSSVLDTRFLFTSTSPTGQELLWDLAGYAAPTTASVEYLFPEVADTLTICLTATNSTGCEDISCTVIIIDPSVDVFVPNTFTPDGDGVNDIFFAVGDPALGRNFLLLIHDRWGEEVHRSEDMLRGWDGTYQGQPCQDGVYIWTVETQDPLTAEIRRLRGHVTLLR